MYVVAVVLYVPCKIEEQSSLTYASVQAESQVRKPDKVICHLQGPGPAVLLRMTNEGLYLSLADYTITVLIMPSHDGSLTQ